MEENNEVQHDDGRGGSGGGSSSGNLLNEDENIPIIPNNNNILINPIEIGNAAGSFKNPILLPFNVLDDPNFNFTKFIDADTPLLVSVRGKLFIYFFNYILKYL